MRIRLFLKLFFLFIALSATIYSLALLNTGHMNDFWTSLGIGKKHNALNWCNNRLESLSGKTAEVAWTLKEDNRQWVIQKNAETKTLEYLDVEKWLARYCIVDIEIYKDSAILDMPVTLIAIAQFNDGTSAKIFRLGDNEIFQINHYTFKSSEWEQALKDLQSLLKI